MLFTILYTVVSVNRFDTKLWPLLNSLLDCFVQLKDKNVQISKFWLLLNSLLDCFVQLKEKNVQISKFVLGFKAQLNMEKG